MGYSLTPEQLKYAFNLMLRALKVIKQDPKHKHLDSNTIEAVEEALTAAE